MDSRKRHRFRRRARLVLMVFLGCLGVVGAHVATLQLDRHEALSRLAREQYLNDVKLPARRGNIYDRNGKPLAIAVDVPSVYANPQQVADPRQAARSLARELHVDLDRVYQRLASDRLFVWLARQVTPQTALRVQKLAIAGVDITKESKRFYPNRDVGAHVIGFAGVDSRGLEGVERALDDLLRGEPQVVTKVRDGHGRVLFDAGLQPESRSHGSNVRLTLDLQIQHAAEVALARIVKKTSAESAIAVVLEVDSADVLAMAVWPPFNLNRASKARPASRRNRALTDMFEPGSALKPLVVAAALDAGVVRPRDIFFCEDGALEIGGHTIRDSKPHGWLDVRAIIQKSSNIGAAKIGQKLGKARMAEALRRFGMGHKTGLRFPGESAGLLRPPRRWSEVGTATISFGHGVAVTALQLAVGHRVLAARGLYRAPRLLLAVERPDGSATTQASRGEHRVLRAESARVMTRMMQAAAGPEGTGWRAQVAGFTVAGKTGTAQKIDPVAGGYSSDRFVAVFAGFLPADAPRAVVVVVVDEPKKAHSGGAVAAPVFAEIAEAAMLHMGVAPSASVLAKDEAVARPQPEPVAPPVVLSSAARRRPTPRGVMPSFLGLTARQVVQQYAELGLGLELTLSGSGQVVGQEPAPGSRVEDGPLAGGLKLVMASP